MWWDTTKIDVKKSNKYKSVLTTLSSKIRWIFVSHIRNFLLGVLWALSCAVTRFRVMKTPNINKFGMYEKSISMEWSTWALIHMTSGNWNTHGRFSCEWRANALLWEHGNSLNLCPCASNESCDNSREITLSIISSLA